MMLSAMAALAMSAPDPVQGAAFFDEFEAVCSADDGALWGESLCGKMVLVDRETRAAFANAPAPGFEAAGDLFTGSIPENIGIANTSFEWEGETWIMVITPLPKEAAERRALAMHEAFHGKQAALGFSSREGQNDHLATRDGRLWLRLEGAALAAALADPTDAWRGKVRDALAFNARRARDFPEAMDDEAALVLHEGLAEYTGIKLGGGEQAETMAIARIESAAERESLVRAVGYVMGPAYGLLLDRSGYNWKERAAEGAPLPILLRAAMGHDDEAAAERAAPYGYADLLAEETARAEALEAELAMLRAKLIDGPVLVLPFRQMNVSFNPNRVVTLDDKGTVYPGATVSDGWGKIVVDDVILISPTWSFGVVPLSGDMNANAPAGEGWTLELAEGWRAEPGTRDGEWVLSEAP